MTAPVYRACYVCGFKPRARLMRSPTCPPCSAWFDSLGTSTPDHPFDFGASLRARRVSLGLPEYYSAPGSPQTMWSEKT